MNWPINDVTSVWRVVRGPNNDWPLAVCDYRSVNLDSDPLASDIVLKDVASEDFVLRANPGHSWYYMSDQNVEDVLIFRNAASQDAKRPCKTTTHACRYAKVLQSDGIVHLTREIQVPKFPERALRCGYTHSCSFFDLRNDDFPETLSSRTRAESRVPNGQENRHTS